MSDHPTSIPNGHPAPEQLEKFVRGELAGEDLVKTGDHIADCPECSGRIAEPSMRSAVLVDTPGDPHLSYEELKAIADLGAEVPEHIGHCEDCRTALEDLTTLRKDLEEYDAASVVSAEPSGGWSELFSPKILKWALVPVLGALIIAALLFWRSFGTDTPAVANADVPTPGPNGPSDVTVPSPGVEKTSPAESKIELVDGGRVIGIDGEGNVMGLDSRNWDARVKAALEKGEIRIDGSAKELSGDTGVLMGRDNPAVPFRLQSPVGRVIETRRPRFAWEPLEGAESYRVEVFDEGFDRIASSEETSENTWTIRTLLEPGKTFVWQVVAKKDGKEIRSPVRPAPDARFRVVTAAAARGIAEARRSGSSLLLGIAYAEAGMLREAEQEFVRLQKRNPRSKEVAELLRKIRAAR